MLIAIATLALAVAPEPLAYDLRADVPVTVGLAAAWLISEYAVKKELAPVTCRWCVTNPIDEAARGIRAPLLAQQAGASTASDLLGPILTPLTMLGVDWLLAWRSGATWQDGAVDALIIAEALMASEVVNQVVKFSVGRERPYVAGLPAAQKPLTAQPSDNNLSFYSGHSSEAFCLVAAAATVARLRGYRQWWVLLLAGVPLAVTTALLRMVADKHYLSDVWVGSSMGALIGFGLPMLFHRPLRVGPVTLTPSGAGVAGDF